MKKTLLILLTVFIACKSKQENITSKKIEAISNSKNPNYKALKEFKGDTLKYLQTNFLEHSDFYVGKPLSSLFDDLEIDIKAYSNSYGSNLYLSNGLMLSFYNRKQEKLKIKNKKNPLVLTFGWEVSLPQEKVVELLRKNDGRWTEEEKKYYGQNTIKEIGMVVPNY
jgi:hypothetical protein